MKKVILSLFTSICVLSSFAQQIPLQTQYLYNYSSLNPAAVGENDYVSLRASARNQWTNFSQNDISTEHITLTNGFGNTGIGVTLANHETGGYFSTTSFKLAFSHRVIVSGSEFYIGTQKVVFPKSELYLGISGGAKKYNEIEAVNDAAVLANTPLVPQATFGIYYKVKDFNIGVSIPGILNSNIEITENTNVDEAHLYAMMSYTKQLNDFWKVQPSVLMKAASEEYYQFDANVNVKFRDKVWLGTSYREDFGPSVYVGLDFGRLFSIYSNDISTSKMSNYSNGTHELTIGYDFKPLSTEEKVVKKEKLVLDSDNDGVVDSLDLCPNLAGSVEAHGCPDIDKDGIPDQYDLCPTIPGNIEAGCPDLTDIEKQIIKDVIENLNFEQGSDRIKRSSYENLAKLAIMLKQNPGMFLEIHGHASAEGESTYNLGLSARRAKSVERFLLQRGISQNKLLIRFYGEESPLNSNLDERQRSLNRRVEFSIRFHLNDQEEVRRIEKAYNDALLNANISVPEPSIENQIEEVEDGLRITRSNNQIVIRNFNNMEIQNEISNTDQFNEDFDSSFTNDVEEIVAEEKSTTVITDPDSYFLLVVGTFSSKENATNFIKKSKDNLRYKELNDRYYVYAYSSSSKEDVKRFKLSYTNCNGCWIK